MSQEAENRVAASWRRRHPALARFLLYGAGLALVALAVVLLLERGKADRQDRLVYLNARLDALDVIAATDSTGDELEKALDEVFADPDLPAALRQRALRARAVLHLKRGDASEALAALDEAEELAEAPADHEAIRLERVQVLLADGRETEALAALDGPETSAHPALAAWRALLRAQALVGADRRDDALRVLDDGLEALPRPLPDAGSIVFCITRWTPAEAALQATQSLADLAGAPLGPGPWLRLLELAPRDLLAAETAARALHQEGHEQAAARAWAWAVSLNGGRPRKRAAADPVLGALEKNRVEALKAAEAGGR